MPRLCGFYPGIHFTTEEKAGINLSQGILVQIFQIYFGGGEVGGWVEFTKFVLSWKLAFGVLLAVSFRSEVTSGPKFEI